ncbi:MAG: L-2-hydroxyglutarate oxidase [Syntrophobacteraceae bacterium]|nr:L-2-hydroxyglutarate oxidase [Syntrophobacteraceae bacterium]
MDAHFDVAVVGAGILGPATAMKLLEALPGLKVAVLEKESRIAGHQTGHNSGVIHSGIYYRPGSLKARLCVSGARQLVNFCRDHQVPFELCGKVVIAVREDEIPRLRELHSRGTANGVPGLRLLSPDETREIEPHARCFMGLHVPATGIVDFREVAAAYVRVFQALGGRLLLDHRVLEIHPGDGHIRIETNRGPIIAGSLINCAGLYSDHMARMAGSQPTCMIVPFRGEYYRIKPERNYLVRNLIYPVPDSRFPFLGVHFTRMMDGRVEAGPNAVPAWAREGYTRTDIVPGELIETLKFEGYRRLVLRYWKPGLMELTRSFSKSLFTRALQRLIPQIRKEDLEPGGSGVRAQALGADGSLLDDFVIVAGSRMVHVLNAPSPAATSSLAIADHIVSVAAPFL